MFVLTRQSLLSGRLKGFHGPCSRKSPAIHPASIPKRDDGRGRKNNLLRLQKHPNPQTFLYIRKHRMCVCISKPSSILWFSYFSSYTEYISSLNPFLYYFINVDFFPSFVSFHYEVHILCIIRIAKNIRELSLYYILDGIIRKTAYT
jgi:hypothetical protein